MPMSNLRTKTDMAHHSDKSIDACYHSCTHSQCHHILLRRYTLGMLAKKFQWGESWVERWLWQASLGMESCDRWRWVTTDHFVCWVTNAHYDDDDLVVFCWTWCFSTQENQQGCRMTDAYRRSCETY
jgi:hypothetical protein